MKPETTIKAELYATAIQQITGERPILNDVGNKIQISFTPGQQILLRQWLKDQLKPGQKPADVDIDVAPVVVPVAIEKLWPFALGLIALGYVAGKVSR